MQQLKQPSCACISNGSSTLQNQDRTRFKRSLIVDCSERRVCRNKPGGPRKERPGRIRWFVASPNSCPVSLTPTHAELPHHDFQGETSGAPSALLCGEPMAFGRKQYGMNSTSGGPIQQFPAYLLDVCEVRSVGCEKPHCSISIRHQFPMFPSLKTGRFKEGRGNSN